MQRSETSVSIQSSKCPLSGRCSITLYYNELPIIPAAIYLKHLEMNVERDANTLRTHAYGLKPFFVFLNKGGVSFWQVTVATIKQYKRFYLNSRDENGQFVVKRKTALQYLRALKGLIFYWRGPEDNDPLFLDAVAETDGLRRRQRARGLLSHVSWARRISNSLWEIRIPISERHEKRRLRGLSIVDCQRVMAALNRFPKDHDRERMLFYRDRAIWTFLLMSGLRKGELCRIKLEDVDQVNGLIRLRERDEHSFLGDLKSGPDDIYVTPHNPFWPYVNSWLLEGRWLAEEKQRQQGLEDHGLLFCARNGRPLTHSVVEYLFIRIRKAARFSREIPFFPHITRHTIATLMLNHGVALEEVQRFLRHRSIMSTQIYAQIADPNYRKALERFWNRQDPWSLR